MHAVTITVPDKTSQYGCRAVTVQLNDEQYKEHLQSLRDRYAQLMAEDQEALEIAKLNVNRYKHYVDFFNKEMEKL